MLYLKNALILLFLIQPIVFTGNTAEAEKLKVGVIAPLTGPLKEHGYAIVAGLELGIKHANCGESTTLFIEDDAYEPKNTLTAARKLIETNHIQILMIVGSGPTHAVAPLAERAKLPVLALAGDASVATNRPFIIRLRKSAEEEGIDIADLARKHGASKIALVCSQNEFTLSVCNGIQKSAPSQVIFREDLTPDTTDFRIHALKIKTLQATHIIPILVPGKLGLFAKQLAELGLQIPLLGGVFFESSSDIESSGGALGGASYIMPDTSPEFKAIYEELDSVAAGSIAWGAIFYDVGRMICTMQGSKQDPLTYFKSIKGFNGAVGEISFRAINGDQYFSYPFIEKTLPSTPLQ